MIINGKGVCDYCKRVILVDDHTKKISNMTQLVLYCTKCFCNIMKKDKTWIYYNDESGEWKTYIWHELQLKSQLENRSIDEIISELPRFYQTKCNWCKRVLITTQVDNPEQIAQLEEQEKWLSKCWVCNCKQGGLRDHIDLINVLVTKKPCGC